MAEDLHQPRPTENPALAAAIEAGAAHIDEHEAHTHVVPGWLLLTVFAALILLTFMTVAVTWVDFGRTANVWIALVIAAVKAGLVALYFMHLRWDSPFNGFILCVSLFFVALFIGIVVLDSKEYNVNFYAPPPTAARPTQ
jgi:cytochrome c oxidase subunit 4